MCAVEGGVSSGFDCSVEADDIVVTDRPESAGTVPAFDVGGGDVLFRTGGGTVNDNSVFHLENLLSFVYFKLLIIK